jgi:hypothetical protein
MAEGPGRAAQGEMPMDAAAIAGALPLPKDMTV